jgi:hypothetical protein
LSPRNTDLTLGREEGLQRQTDKNGTYVWAIPGLGLSSISSIHLKVGGSKGYLQLNAMTVQFPKYDDKSTVSREK